MSQSFVVGKNGAGLLGLSTAFAVAAMAMGEMAMAMNALPTKRAKDVRRRSKHGRPGSKSKKNKYHLK